LYSQWLKPAFIKVWNLYHLKDEDENSETRNKTNCLLERYNRTINDLFPSAHPPLPTFVETLEKEGRAQVKNLRDIDEGVVTPREYPIANLPWSIVKAYEAFAVTDEYQDCTGQRKCDHKATKKAKLARKTRRTSR